MLETTQSPPWMFNLEGTFLGFFSSKSGKSTSIILEVDQEQLTIKLPKELRNSLCQQLHPGDCIRCIGRSQVDFKASCIKLRAYQVLLPPRPQDESFSLSPTDPSCTASRSPLRSARSRSQGLKVHAKQKRAKILICHKSGCQKRGGRQLVTTLEKTLREHHLRDQVEIQYTGCQKRCSKAPNLTVMPGKHHYDRSNLNNLLALVKTHLSPPEPELVQHHVTP